MTRIPNHLPVEFHWKSDLVSRVLRRGEGQAKQRRLEIIFRFFALLFMGEEGRRSLACHFFPHTNAQVF